MVYFVRKCLWFLKILMLLVLISCGIIILLWCNGYHVPHSLAPSASSSSSFFSSSHAVASMSFRFHCTVTWFMICHGICVLQWFFLCPRNLKLISLFPIPNLAFTSPSRIPSFVDSLSENMLKFLFLDQTCHIHICGSSCIKNMNLLILISSSQEILVVKYSCLHYDDIWMKLYA